MHAVHRLRLDRRVPPRIEQENVIRRMQRDARARCLQAHEHDRRAQSPLERLHRFLPVQRHAGQLEARQVGETRGQRLAHPVEQHDELREDDGLVTAPDDLGQLFHQQVELAAFGDGRVEPRQQIGVAASLAQARQQGEEAEGPFAHGRADVVAKARQALTADARVFRALQVGQRAEQVHLNLGRQFLGDLVLRAAEDKRRQLLAQAIERAGAVLAEHGFERLPRAEQAGQQVAEHRPQVQLAVFQRRAREHEAMARPDGKRGVGDLRVRVLDELPLVEHGVAELDLVEQVLVLAQLGVAGQPDDRVAPEGKIVPGLEHVALELREKAGYLLAPHRHDAGRADDQVGPARQRAGHEQRQHLERLAQAHFVGEESVAADFAQVAQPFHATPLIRPQAVRQGLRRGQRREHAPPPGLDLRRHGDLEAIVVEEGEDQIRRELAVGRRGLLHRPPPLDERVPFLLRQRHDPEIRQNHRGAPALPRQDLDLLLGQEALAGPENPAQPQAGAVALVRLRLDLDRPFTFREVRRVVVELDDEIAPPHWQHRPDELRDLLQQIEQINVRLLPVVKMRLPGIGGQADELAPLAGADVRQPAVAVLRSVP